MSPTLKRSVYMCVYGYYPMTDTQVNDDGRRKSLANALPYGGTRKAGSSHLRKHTGS